MNTAAPLPIMPGYDEVLQFAIVNIEKNRNKLSMLPILDLESGYQRFFGLNANSLSAQDIETMRNQWNSLRNCIESSLHEIFREQETIQSSVNEELISWKRGQAFAGNGAPFSGDLTMLQLCIECLLQLIIEISQYVNKMISLVSNKTLAELQRKVLHAQEFLITSSFIVDKQPSQVIKKNNKFDVAVRWLIGPGMGISQSVPDVECIILSETQAKSLTKTPQVLYELSREPSGDLQNNKGRFEFNPKTHYFGANFKNMQIKEIKRPEKRNTESVMDEKFALFFYTSCCLQNIQICVWTLSLPIVVIVHSNQEPQSWATITWDNAFSDRKREPFAVPDKVPWSEFASALNTKFTSMTNRSLTEDKLRFIHEKLSHSNEITWTQFCKVLLPNRNFSFWEWFYANMKLTKDYLQKVWEDGLIVGFIGKDQAKSLLHNMVAGTFLLRFSDSQLGSISIGVRDQDEVKMLQPWTANDLKIRCLADRVHDIEQLKCLYNQIDPLKPKDMAFGHLYTIRLNEEQTTREQGYVPTHTVAQVANTRQHSTLPSPNSAIEPALMEMYPSINVNNDIGTTMHTTATGGIFGNVQLTTAPTITQAIQDVDMLSNQDTEAINIIEQALNLFHDEYQANAMDGHQS